MEENHFQLWLICNHHKDINWFTALTKCVWTIFHLVNIWQLIYSTYAKFRCSVVTYVLYLRWTGNEHESLKWIGHSHCHSKFLSMLFLLQLQQKKMLNTTNKKVCVQTKNTSKINEWRQLLQAFLIHSLQCIEMWRDDYHSRIEERMQNYRIKSFFFF